MSDRTPVRQFQCPACGFGHVELECLAADDEVHCFVCSEERQVEVRLERWIEEPGPARVRGVLAA